MRAEEFFRRRDTGNVAHFMELMTDDCQGIDGGLSDWLRGTGAIEAYLTGALANLSEMRTVVTDGDVRRFGDVEVETMGLHESFVLDGRPQQNESAATLVWRRSGNDWKVAVIHLR